MLAPIAFHPPVTARVVLAIVLRFVHYAAGITWVGMLYFFNLVQTPFFKELDPALKPKIMQTMTWRALQWFRWASVVTVLVGIWYWMMAIGGNVRMAQATEFPAASGGRAIWTFFAIWIVAWAVQFALLVPQKGALNNGLFLGVLVAIIIAAASWGYLAINRDPWLGNNVLSIGVGGGIGFFMLLNVWGIIWRHNKKIIRATAAGAPPANAAYLARQAYLASRINFFLSFPMLFFMITASHFPLFGAGPSVRINVGVNFHRY